MGADPLILDVQAHDAEADRIRHVMATLPELAERDTALARKADLATGITALEEQRRGPQAELARLDDEVLLLRDKLSREEAKLGSGAVTNARELTSLQAEVESLRRRIGELEDKELDAMEELEQTQPELDVVSAGIGEVDAQLADVEGRLAVARRRLEDELAAVETARTGAAAQLPPDLLARYDRLRAASVNGIAAARLVDGSCGGCHVRLAAGELVEVREASLPRCPSCEAIIVIEDA